MKAYRMLIVLSFVTLGLVSTGLGSSLHAQAEAPPGEGFQKVSDLVELPDFVPGLGVLYVDPGTLPAGPFLAYDRDGKLVSTLYMLPLESLQSRTAFEGLDAADQPVDHVDIVFNAGHPGVEAPHYHVILWHVPRERAEALQ